MAMAVPASTGTLPEEAGAKNLRITFRMRTPVCLSYPFITLDSILAHLNLRKSLGQAYYTLPSKTPVPNLIDSAPVLAKWHEYHGSPRAFRCSSVAIFDGADPRFFATTIYKRFEERHAHEVDTKKRYVTLGSGPQRNWAIKLAYVPCNTVTFYARGYPQAIASLLLHLPAIGKKIAIGFGDVASFSIDETEEDWSVVKDGKAQRMIPVWALKSYEELVPMAYRAPYWSRASVELCAPPGTKVELIHP